MVLIIKYLSRADLGIYLTRDVYKSDLSNVDKANVTKILNGYANSEYSPSSKPITITDGVKSNGFTSILMQFTGINVNGGNDADPMDIDIEYALIKRGIGGDLGTNLYWVRNSKDVSNRK